jgi:hypothetical protein
VLKLDRKFIIQRNNLVFRLKIHKRKEKRKRIKRKKKKRGKILIIKI